MSIYDQTVPSTVAPTATEVAPAQNTPVPAPQTTMTTAQANQTLAQYGIDPNQVLSSTNIANTVNNPAPAPDDLLGIRANISRELGVDTQQNAFTRAMNAARERVTNLNKFNALAEGQRVNLGVIRGEQAQERNLAAPEIQALQDQANFEKDKLDAIIRERDYRVGVAEGDINRIRELKTTYVGAGIKFGDSQDTIEKKISKFTKKKEEDEYKKTLKAKAIELGISTKSKKGGSMKTKDLEKAIAKSYGDKAASDKILRDLEIQSKKASIANTYSEISARGAAATAPGASKELAAVASALQANGNDWGKTADFLASKGYDVSSGSAIDNELRRRNGMAPITAASSKPLSAESTKVLENAKSGTKALQTVENLSNSMLTRGLALLPGSPGAGTYEAAKNEVLDVLTRLRTGAALTQSEEDFYRNQLPTFTDSASTRAYKIGVFKNLFTNIANQIQPGAISGEGDIEVVDLATGQIGTISSSEFDASKYRKTGN